MKRFLTLTSSLLILNVVATSCCSVVAKSGDAKILKCPQIFIHQPGTENFRMELPAVSLAQAGTHVLRVRDLPAYLKGLFNYGVDMTVPYGTSSHSEARSDKDAPWHDAKISITFRKPDGTEVFKQVLLLGSSPHAFSQGHDGWVVGWNLGTGSHHMDPVPVMVESFDIIINVEQPSQRASDQISTNAWAIYRPKP
jgi:hypothetical protein